MNTAHPTQTHAFDVLMKAHLAGIEYLELETDIDSGSHSYNIAFENCFTKHTLTISSDSSDKKTRELCSKAQSWISAARDSNGIKSPHHITPRDTTLLNTALHAGWNLQSIFHPTCETFTLTLTSQGNHKYFNRTLIINKAMNSDRYDVELYRHTRLEELGYNDEKPVRKRMRTELILKLIQEEEREM